MSEIGRFNNGIFLASTPRYVNFKENNCLRYVYERVKTQKFGHVHQCIRHLHIKHFNVHCAQLVYCVDSNTH